MVSAPRGFSGPFWALIAATFLGFLGVGTVLPVLAPHVRHDLGGSDQTVGFVIGVFYIVALASRFLSGPMADSRGRKIVVMMGVGTAALAGTIYLLPFGLTGIYLARFLQGFAEACLYTGAAAWAVELSGVERAGQALGYISSGIWGGISFGPVVGQWLGTFERAAMMQAASAGAALVLLVFVPEHYEPKLNEGRRSWFPRSLWIPGLATGFVNVHYPVITGFLILHLAAHGNSGPYAFTAYAGMILLSRFFLGGLPDRIDPRITFYAGNAMMIVALVLLATGPSFGIAIASATLLGFGFSFPFSAVASTCLRRSAENEKGTVVGILGVFYDVFVGAGAFAAGIVSKNFSYPAAFIMAAVANIVAASLGPSVFPSQKSR